MNTQFKCASDLNKEFGLTDTILKQYGEPDKYKTNPHNWGGHMMRLYDMDKIKVFLDRDDIKAKTQRVLAMRPMRQQNALKAQENRDVKFKKLAMAIIKGLMVYPNVDNYTYTGLYSLCQHDGQTHLFNKGEYDKEFVMGIEAFRAMLRHKYTNYDEISNSLEEWADDMRISSDVRFEMRVWHLGTSIDIMVDKMYQSLIDRTDGSTIAPSPKTPYDRAREKEDSRDMALVMSAAA